jgi:hypothetical protein
MKYSIYALYIVIVISHRAALFQKPTLHYDYGDPTLSIQNIHFYISLDYKKVDLPIFGCWLHIS